MYEGGDHLIMVGEVSRMTYEQGEARPLLYFKGGYAKLS